MTAIRDLPDEAQAQTLGSGKRAWRWAAGLLWSAAAALLYLAYGRNDRTVALICAKLALAGLTTLPARILERTRVRPERVTWARYTLLGLGLIAIWGCRGVNCWGCLRGLRCCKPVRPISSRSCCAPFSSSWG